VVGLADRVPGMVGTIAAVPGPVVVAEVTVVGTTAVDREAGPWAGTHGPQLETASRVGPKTGRTAVAADWRPRARGYPSRVSRTR
jgi:hypothetical protein